MNSELEQANAQLVICKNEYSVLIQKYEIGANDDFIQFSAEYTETAYSAENILKKFEKDSFYAEYYDKQAEAYQSYSEALEVLEKKMTSPIYNQEYFERVQEYIISEAAYYNNEAALAKKNRCYEGKKGGIAVLYSNPLNYVLIIEKFFLKLQRISQYPERILLSNTVTPYT